MQVTLNVSGGWAFDILSGEALVTARQTIKAWAAAEDIKAENARVKNELEAYIIKTRESLETDELLMKVRGEGRGREVHEDSWMKVRSEGGRCTRTHG